MALLKAIETESGVIVTYHNLTLMKNTVDGTLTAYLNSYTTAEAREAGRPPVVTGKPYVIPPEVWKDHADGIEAAAYEHLKSLPEFIEAVDDLAEPSGV